MAAVGATLLVLVAGCATEPTATTPPTGRMIRQAQAASEPSGQSPGHDQRSGPSEAAKESRPSRSGRPRLAKPDPITQRIARMSLRDKVRQLVVLGFGGRRAPVRLIRSVHPGGLIYFAPNLASKHRRSAGCRASRRWSPAGPDNRCCS